LLFLFITKYFSPSGIFVALALRFDVSRGKQPQYFKSSFSGYIVGLVLTIIVMNWFQAAQVIGCVVSFYSFLSLDLFLMEENFTVSTNSLLIFGPVEHVNMS